LTLATHAYPTVNPQKALVKKIREAIIKTAAHKRIELSAI